ncbi:hypothetical protein RUE5091_04200 [Ruegeria denitrificans]|uniref:DUF2938 domain-containing protein n=1 Tax=Ruegeria denitrificans TaxID=1715692 RepID=A0A0N7MAX7_9RHOB|nr:DUF2938 domain-containing protein [Ruegeria denitrificans]CUK18097.1 hypothetical protein RUE5091_04200 [Ruegeria denitrificans]
MTTEIFFSAVLIGIGATAFMDVVALFQKLIFSQQSLNYAMVGRWLGHVVQGQIVHRHIMASDPVPAERLLGWSAHYLTGVVFALGFLAVVGRGWLEAPSLLPAIAFGILTVLAPFLILQPGMGVGLAARLTPDPQAARLKSVFAHFSFGTGLWVAANCVSISF